MLRSEILLPVKERCARKFLDPTNRHVAINSKFKMQSKAFKNPRIISDGVIRFSMPPEIHIVQHNDCVFWQDADFPRVSTCHRASFECFPSISFSLRPVDYDVSGKISKSYSLS